MQNDHTTIHSCPFPIPVCVTNRHHYPAIRGKVNLGNLRSLSWDVLLAVHPEPPAPARFGLVNARSIINKSFILKDFFKSQELDFLFISETWLSVGESSAFTELVPDGCSYFNSPRTSGRGGGTATVCKSDFKCKQISLSTSSTSFEHSLFELGHSNTVLCAVVYRPPKYNRDFLTEFSVFLADLMPKYDRVLIVGDFNIHVRCPENPLARDFLNIIDSFNLVQSVLGPTHERGHTLDLVLSHGLPVFNIGTVMLSSRITCQYCLKLLSAVTQLNLALRLAGVGLLTPPLLLTSRLLSNKTG